MELEGKKKGKYCKSLRAEGENTDALEGSYLDPRTKNEVGPGDIIRNRLHDLSKIFRELFSRKTLSAPFLDLSIMRVNRAV